MYCSGNASHFSQCHFYILLKFIKATASYHNHLIINTAKCATFSIRLSPIQYTIEWHSVYD